MRNRLSARQARVLAGTLACALALTLGAPSAQAGGFDMPGLGTRGLGRAGAWGVRSDSPLALHLNPANLARLDGINVEISLHLASLQSCFDRTGTPTRDGNGDARAQETPDRANTPVGSNNGNVNDFGAPSQYAGIEYPEVCNDAGIFPIPQMALSFRPHERVGIGIGLIAPNNVGHRTFGAASGPNLGTYAVPGAPTGRLPVSSRHDVIEANVLLAFVAVGAGIELHPRLRVGASFGYGFASTGFTTAVTPVHGEDIARDIIAVVDAHDRFVPRIGLSVDAEPVDGLELMAGFTWTGDVKASGDLNLRPVFWGDIAGQANRPRMGRDEGWENVTFPVNLTAPQTSVLNAGVRYAMARPGARSTSDRINGVPALEPAEGDPARSSDPMRDEVFDLELDVVVTLGSRVKSFNVVASERPGPWLVSGVISLPAPPEISLPHNWRTQVMVALGGDVNVLPEVLALRWGLVYETHGVEAGYERLDFTPWQLFGGSFGMTLRIQRFELSLAYMHTHYFTVNNSESQARVTSPVAAGEGTIINAGRFTASTNLISLGLSYRFR